MGSIRRNGSQFRGTFMGYNKADVDDYVLRAESELEIQESRQGKLEQQIAELNEEIERLKNAVTAERSEKQELLDKSIHSNKTIADLRNQVEEATIEKEKTQKELKEFQESISTSGVNPKTIQDAILNAQRMSETLLQEVNEKAREILHQAESARQEQEKAGKAVLEIAEAEARKVTEEAKRKRDNLQKDYDRILLDVTEFKAELMGMYRRHMELLAALPEKETHEIGYDWDLSDYEFSEEDIEDFETEEDI